MKYHVVLNACAPDFQQQAAGIAGFLRQQRLKIEEGNTYIISNGQWDGDDKRTLADLVPTESVIFVSVAYYDPEVLLDFFARQEDRAGLYLFGSNYSAGELAVRLAARLGGTSLTECCGLAGQDRQLMGMKRVYAGHLAGQFALEQAPYCIAIDKNTDEGLPPAGPRNIVATYDISALQPPAAAIGRTFTPAASGASLADSDFAVVLGQGARNESAVAEARDLAQRMGADFGVSRPVAMHGWSGMETLVGVSGIMLHPQVCIAAAVSGMPALYAGLKKSGFIVAVNRDDQAPITHMADVVIIDDYRAVLSALAERLERRRNHDEG